LKIAFSNDHAAVASRHLINELKQAGHEVIDYGVSTEARVDYPDVAAPALNDLVGEKVDRVLLVCGSGVGMSIVANRIAGVRCALITDPWAAEMCRRHNDCNCLALRSREQSEEMNSKLTRIWLETPFDGGRHQERIEKIEAVGSACGFARLVDEEKKQK
jgi:ribose 5-phosphate isomerase B